MDLTDLQTFAAVARTGGITRAADELNTVQSNVTARIRDLEHELGAVLFNRHPRGVTLTRAGRQLLPFAAEAARVVDAARRAVADGPEPSGSLRIGTLETTAAVRLPPILTEYCRAYPEVDLSVSTGTTGALTADVLEHRIDGAFVAAPVDHPDLVGEVIVTEELVLVTAPHIRDVEALRRRRDGDTLSTPDLKQAGPLKAVVFRTGCTYRRTFEAVLAERGLGGIRWLEFGTLDGIIGCVGAGLGITLLPYAVVAGKARAGLVATHALPAAQARVDTLFIRRRDAYVPSAMTRLIECAKACAAGEGLQAAE